ncbi:MAG: dihydroorotate dehydrogenase electron transfer subunit [Bacteroidales bacterium]|nr:dihydroorotate dehydrogenase electron transfer subunit [Bacteroidales bacterium]
MKKVNRRLRVIENRPLSPEVFLLTLGSEQPLPEIKPGQFANFLVENTNDVFLRRPFSIHDVDFSHNFIKFFIQKVGKGTEQLSKLKSGDTVDVLFPLGNGFTVHCGFDTSTSSVSGNRNAVVEPVETPATLLVGGGCGIAPLLYLAKILNQNGIQPTILIGGRSKKNIFRVEEYVKYGNVLLITEDGSLGEKGLITEHSIFNQQKFDQIYCCGPEAMMKAVGRLAMRKNTPCQISLENTMACGIGACLCCVTKTVDGHVCVCTEGPVFDLTKLKIEN